MSVAKASAREAQIAMQDEASDLAVLHPDVEVEIAGRKLVVREYRLLDGMRARAKGKPLIDALQAMLESGKVNGATTEDYMNLFAEHFPLLVDLMAEAVDGADKDWIEGLSEPDGYALTLAWWGVCGRFFVRVVIRQVIEKTMARAAMATNGPKPSTPSSAPDTEASPISLKESPSVN